MLWRGLLHSLCPRAATHGATLCVLCRQSSSLTRRASILWPMSRKRAIDIWQRCVDIQNVLRKAETKQNSADILSKLRMECSSVLAKRPPDETPEPQTSRTNPQDRQLLARPHERKPLHLGKRRGAIRSRAAPWESAVAAGYVVVDFQIGWIAAAKIAARQPCARNRLTLPRRRMGSRRLGGFGPGPLTSETGCRIIRPMKKHRRTGRPVGRPPTLPFDLPEQILRDLESRMDKTTLLVRPDIGNLAKRLKVSRSSIKREIVSLRNSGFIELQHINEHPTDKISTILYKLTKAAPAQNSADTGS